MFAALVSGYPSPWGQFVSLCYERGCGSGRLQVIENIESGDVSVGHCELNRSMQHHPVR